MSKEIATLTAEHGGKIVYEATVLEPENNLHEIYPPFICRPYIGAVNKFGSVRLALSGGQVSYPIALCRFTIRFFDSSVESLMFDGKFIETELDGSTIIDIYAILDFPRDCEESAAKIIKEPTTFSLSDREDESTEGFKILQYVAIDEVVTEKLKVKVSEWPPSVIKAEFGGETFYYNLADCHKKS